MCQYKTGGRDFVLGFVVCLVFMEHFTCQTSTGFTEKINPSSVLILLQF